MRTIRLVMAEKGLGRAIAALLVYFVVLQAVTGAVATAAMASSTGHSAFVLCSGEPVPASPGSDDGSGTHSCCSALCRTACTAASCLEPSGPGLAGAQGGELAHDADTDRSLPGQRPLRLVPEARAPPASSPA